MRRTSSNSKIIDLKQDENENEQQPQPIENSFPFIQIFLDFVSLGIREHLFVNELVF